jgi:hypothetical protein
MPIEAGFKPWFDQRPTLTVDPGCASSAVKGARIAVLTCVRTKHFSPPSGCAPPAAMTEAARRRDRPDLTSGAGDRGGPPLRGPQQIGESPMAEERHHDAAGHGSHDRHSQA